MGCDIHAYIEHRPATQAPRDGRHWWSDFGGRINPGRNYAIFNALAGVRGDEAGALVPPRGLPDDIAYAARSDAFLHIDYSGRLAETEGYCTPDDAARYVQHGSEYSGEYRPMRMTVYDENRVATVTVEGAEHDGKPTTVTHPDWHSHSWLTPSEWERAVAKGMETAWGGPADNPKYVAMSAAMRALESTGRLVRVVFWFDN